MVQGEAMMSLFFIGIALLGLIIGSFLNVVILRFGTGLSVAKGRSRCFSCDHTLSWYELLPLVSYVIQWGRCRHCASRISIQYPLVEILTSFLFVVSAHKIVVMNISPLWFTMYLLILFAFVSTYIVITVYDVRHKMIPDIFSYLASGIALLYILISSPASIVMNILSGVGAFLFFYVFWFFSKGRLMGLGDGKLAISLGILLGPSATIAAILIAFWSGAFVSVFLILRDKIAHRKLGVTMKSEIPFAPFIIFGTLMVFFLHLDINTISSWLAI